MIMEIIYKEPVHQLIIKVVNWDPDPLRTTPASPSVNPYSTPYDTWPSGVRDKCECPNKITYGVVIPIDVIKISVMLELMTAAEVYHLILSKTSVYAMNKLSSLMYPDFVFL